MTTLFDFYGMPESWPGVRKAKEKPAEQIPVMVEDAMAEQVRADWGDMLRTERFVPYVQMFEVEALMFAGPREMAGVFERPEIARKFEQIVSECGGCERIDDTPTGAPSKRITQIHPKYNKGDGRRAQAPIIVERTGLDRIRSACPHFDDWLNRLEKRAVLSIT